MLKPQIRLPERSIWPAQTCRKKSPFTSRSVQIFKHIV
jgi:hypothetical protein